MSLRQLNSNNFAGCERLKCQYITIGQELLKFEKNRVGYSYKIFTAYTLFREGIAFVPVEVLESYLDDLLDLEISDKSLKIELDGVGKSAGWFLLALTVAFLSLAAYLISRSGAPLLLFIALTFLASLPFMLVAQQFCLDRAARRMQFAKVLKHEISRRRGQDPENRMRPAFTLERFLVNKSSVGLSAAMRASSVKANTIRGTAARDSLPHNIPKKIVVH